MPLNELLTFVAGFVLYSALVQKITTIRYTAVVIYVGAKTKPRRESRRKAPQLSSGFCCLTYLAIAIAVLNHS